MFTPINSASAPPFIQKFDVGQVNQFTSLFYCQAAFSALHYHDLLFDRFTIPFPDRLNMAVVKRKSEYLAARYAAKKVLQAYGCDAVPDTGPDRAPIWPSGWNGSISHAHECAIAVITPADSGLTPGIDVEFFAPENLVNTAYIFSSKHEQQLLKASNIDYPTALLIAFSAKESLFKALYPKVGRFFDFDAARIYKIEPLNKMIILELTQTLSPCCVKGKQIRGYYAILNDRVITVIA